MIYDTELQSFGHRGGDEEPTLPAGGQARGRTPTQVKEHVQASFGAHGARAQGVAPTALPVEGATQAPAIILCTGHSDSVSPERAREMGLKGFLLKPQDKEELAAAVRRVLDGNTLE